MEEILVYGVLVGCLRALLRSLWDIKLELRCGGGLVATPFCCIILLLYIGSRNVHNFCSETTILSEDITFLVIVMV